MRVRYSANDQVYEVEVARASAGEYHVTVDGVTLELKAELRNGVLELQTQAGNSRVWVSRDGQRRFVTAPGIGEVVLERVARRASGGGDRGGGLASPMPGKVVKLLVAVGDEVDKGQPLLIVEAMKTELSIVAPHAGTVISIDAEPGELCEAGKPLVELSEPPAAETPEPSES